MAFDVAEIEDGSGKPGALVYGKTSDPVAEAVAYLARRGKVTFSSLTGNIGSVPKQEVSLLRGVEYVERISRPRLLGTVAVFNQRLTWPRRDVEVIGFYVPWEYVDGDNYLSPVALPDDYLAACYEAAELHANGDALGDIVDDRNNVKREKTGSALETEWFEGGSSNRKKRHAVEDLLRPFLRPLGQLERA